MPDEFKVSFHMSVAKGIENSVYVHSLEGTEISDTNPWLRVMNDGKLLFLRWRHRLSYILAKSLGSIYPAKIT